jgi:hypothetical protein
MWYECLDVNDEVVTEVELHPMEIPPATIIVNGTEYHYDSNKKQYYELPF